MTWDHIDAFVVASAAAKEFEHLDVDEHAELLAALEEISDTDEVPTEIPLEDRPYTMATASEVTFVFREVDEQDEDDDVADAGYVLLDLFKSAIPDASRKLAWESRS